jgi:outer membrane protein assembly factor BamB
MTHSTPILASIHGVRQVIFATQNGLVALNPLTGDLLWGTDYPFNYSTSLGASPVVYQDMIFVSGAHAYGMGSFVVQVNPPTTPGPSRNCGIQTTPPVIG